MSKKYPILLICRTTMEHSSDIHKFINNAFSPDKYDITTVFLHGTIHREQIKAYFGEVIFWQLENTFFRQKLVCALRLLKLYLSKKFKLIICDQYKATAIVNILQRWIKTPHLYSIMRALDHYQSGERNYFIKHRLSSAFKFITVSNAVKNSLLQCAPQLIPEKCIVIHNAIDTMALAEEKLDRKEARKILNIDEHTFVFGTIGTNYQNSCKAHDILISAFAKIQKQLSNTQLLIIGGGDLGNVAIQQVTGSGLTKIVKSTGFLPNAAKYMSALDVFILPSRLEACPKVLLEAMVHKLPIITTIAGGIPEIMGNSTTLVPFDDSDALAAEMLHIYSLSDAERKELGIKISQRLNYFTLEKLQEKYRKLAV